MGAKDIKVPRYSIQCDLKLPSTKGKKLGEDQVPRMVQVLRTGNFNHEFFGRFTVDKKMLRNMVKNFQLDVKKTDIAMDYAHENGQRAAGWFIDLHLRENDTELWAEIDWTPPALTALANKEWRYVSAEFMDNYIDNESGKEFGPTLLGAGLTNRPFVKGMENAIELSELKNDKTIINKGDNNMSKELEDQIKTLSDTVATLTTENATLKSKSQSDENAKKLSDLEAENKRLKDAETKRLADAKVEEKKTTFDKMLSEGKVVERQRDAFMGDDMAKFTELAPKAGEVKLSEPKGDGGDGDEDAPTGDEQDQVVQLAEKLAKDEKIDITEATTRVLSDPKNKALRDKIYADY